MKEVYLTVIYFPQTPVQYQKAQATIPLHSHTLTSATCFLSP